MRSHKTPTAKAIAAEVLLNLSNAGRPLTARQLYDLGAVPQYRQDVSFVVNEMVREGHLLLGPDRQPGEEGGMSGAGARAIRSYMLPEHADRFDPTPMPAPKAKPEQEDEPETAPVIDPDQDHPDPLLLQLDHLESLAAPVTLPMTPDDIRRLRSLAGTGLFSTHLPDWSLYLYGLADRIEQTIQEAA